jgi:recombination protein RecT
MNDIAHKPVVLQYLQTYKDQIAAALPRHITPDRMVRIVTTSIRLQPRLLTANPQSLFGAIIQAAQLGLEPDNGLGHAFLVPFRNSKKHTIDVQLIIGYRGFLHLAWQSGKVIGVDAACVHAKDEFRYTLGLNPVLEHVPSNAEDAGERTHAYCIFHFRDGGNVWRVIGKDRIKRAMAASARSSEKDAPWQTDTDEMWAKTAIRATAKYAPLSIEMQRAVGIDEMEQRQDLAAIIDGEYMTVTAPADEEPEPETKVEAVRKKLEKGKGKDTPQEPRAPAQATPSLKEADSSPSVDSAQESAGPREDDVFSALEELELDPPPTIDPINELAALSDAVSPERSEEFRRRLKTLYLHSRANSVPRGHTSNSLDSVLADALENSKDDGEDFFQ